MSHSDIDSPVPPQDSVKLPWESIDPEESAGVAEAAKPTPRTKKPRRKVKITRAESLEQANSSVSAEMQTESEDSPLSHPIKPIFRTLPPEMNASPILPGPASEEDLVAHAFLSDDATDFIEAESQPELSPVPVERAIADMPMEAAELVHAPIPQNITAHAADWPAVEPSSADVTHALAEGKLTAVEKAPEVEQSAPLPSTEIPDPSNSQDADLDALFEEIASADAADLKALSVAMPGEPANTDAEAAEDIVAPTVLEAEQKDDNSEVEVGSGPLEEAKANLNETVSPSLSLEVETESASADSEAHESRRDDIQRVGDEIFLTQVGGEEEMADASLASAPEIKTQPALASEVEFEWERPALAVTTGGGWTIPLMCAGICLIACCLILPQDDSNRRLMHETQALQANLASVHKQVVVNDAFLAKVMNDPNLAERLASRQLKTIRKGQKVLSIGVTPRESDMSPFSLTTVAPPAPQTVYKPIPGKIADLCNVPSSRLYMLGVAMTMVAVGLVMGFGPKKLG